ncbi:MAG: divalent-cation tolerance protein CutA [Xanthobacteraceae bacterium]
MKQEMPERMVFVYTTYPSLVEAETAGRALLEARLAACVNILPGMISLYRWKGAIERADEVVMIIKTRAASAETVRAAVKEKHSYDAPAILVIPIESVDSAYLAWLTAETGQP